MLGIAWNWQAEVHGGFRPETARRLAALENGCAARRGRRRKTDVAAAARPRPGTRLLRDWSGDRHEVQVTETGYLWRGQSFGSLSVGRPRDHRQSAATARPSSACATGGERS